ncbi:RING zinc finger protein [Plasmodium gonderi]|uniref:RING-type E3 ubiquitin transferase n=1 Tax=Plasmodium gonderi TaxID=77519 RepID=A0A1Y1JDD2_PLAGO|nr:RING zinc finger protein [Plasmodium gonderi]GAW80496.1 RING zinc finger protein [Plasmodium gonderi]
MESYKRDESKHMHFLSNVNSKKKLNIVEKKRILEKVHILPIKKKTSNADALYRKLNLLINEKCVLHEGFIIEADEERKNARDVVKGVINENFHETRKKEDITTKDRNKSVCTNQFEKENLHSTKNGSTLKDDPWEVSHEKKLNSFETDTLSLREENNKNTYNNNHMSLYDEYKNNQLTEEKSHYNESVCYYVVVNCIPTKGIINRDTLIYTDGKCVDNLRKIQLIIIRDKHYKKYEKKLKRKNFSLKKYIFKKGNEFFNEAISLISFPFDSFSSKYNIERVNYHSKLGNKNEMVITTTDTAMKGRNLVLEKILSTYLHPYFKKNRTNLFYSGKLFIINNFSFLVVKIDSDVNVGFVDSSTEICLSVDSYDPFRNVHIVPLYDTLPTTYNYDIFTDYIKPYIERHYINLFSIHDTFFYKGVQFKIMGIDPINIKNGRGRISCNTFIYTTGSIKPTFFDVISKESINYIQCLPLEYKPYAVLNILQQLDADSLLRLFPSTNTNLQENSKNEELILNQLAKYKYIYNNHKQNNSNNGNMLQNIDAQQSQIHNHVEKNTTVNTTNNNLVNEQCAVCFEYFHDYEKCIKLNCFHTYHWKCVKNWFRFNLTCPCCRRQISL